jgi:hypothetical protein
VCRAIRPFASHAALPEVPCTAATVFGLLQQAPTVVNFSVDDYAALPDSILMLTPYQRISSITLQLFYIRFAALVHFLITVSSCILIFFSVVTFGLQLLWQFRDLIMPCWLTDSMHVRHMGT